MKNTRTDALQKQYAFRRETRALAKEGNAEAQALVKQWDDARNASTAKAKEQGRAYESGRPARRYAVYRENRERAQAGDKEAQRFCEEYLAKKRKWIRKKPAPAR